MTEPARLFCPPKRIPWPCDDHGTDPARNHVLQALGSDLTPQANKMTSQQMRMLFPLLMCLLWPCHPSHFRALSLSWAKAVWIGDGCP